MKEFKAAVETDFFLIEIKARIEGNEVDIIEICFGDDPLTPGQVTHFVKKYGELDLCAEIIRQYAEEQEVIKADRAGEEWEIIKLEGLL